VYGTILAIGRSQSHTSNRVVDGAIVAWDAHWGDNGNEPARVDFAEFWNTRLSAMPEPEIGRKMSDLAARHV
jgi:hypothetical protein